MKDNLGDRMKAYEKPQCSQKLMPLLPCLIRLDGKNFSRWADDLEKPYDQRLHNIMVETTKFLVEKLQARAGYTQSDEITILLHSDKYDKEIEFAGKIQKLVSTSASIATAFFNDETAEVFQDKPLAFFDSRVWSVPSKEEAANCFLWRELDATKNSISSTARRHYSHKELHGKGCNEMQEMLHQVGANWNDYPDGFKRGTFVRRVRKNLPFTQEQIERLPVDHEARKDPSLLFERVVVESMELPQFKTIQNRVGFLFYGEDPEV